jgi:hypothetical protein
MRNVDQFRHAIDRGRTGDKVAFSDPAAAPLGTDDAAAATPVTAEQLHMAWEGEHKRGLNDDTNRDGPVYSATDVRQVRLFSSAGGSAWFLLADWPAPFCWP